ncbi:MAG TPA: Fic family protein [Solirubrobacteraceae bacterium]|nr:Fic family protein [Solirubrobacteraceae bacterium]
MRQRDDVDGFDSAVRMLIDRKEIRSSGDYLHWDKLRRLTPPAGLSHHDWWLGIKWMRASSFSLLPLIDAAEDEHFCYGTPPAVLRLLHYVDRHCSGQIAMAEVVSDEQARRHYLVNSHMEEAIRSSQLEGATTTRRVAKEMLRSGREPTDRSELMILNNYRALEFIREGMGERLEPETVLELHRILTEGTLDDPTAAGRLQGPGDERVAVVDATDGSVIHKPPPAEQLPERLRALCDFANRDDEDFEGFMHPVVRAILLHFWLAYDHPFEDGNGRTARALFYWYMRTRGYWMVEYLSISRILREAPAQYSRAFLLTETDEGDTTYFLLHQLHTVKRAVEELHAYLRRKVSEIRDVERLIEGADGLNHRQLALLSDAIRRPEGTYTYQSHATSHRVTHETARNDLLRLHGRGLLRRRKIGRMHAYSAAADLPHAIERLGPPTPK